VYSGTYLENGIRITKENVSLLGISHELGDGDDSGMPFIKSDGTATVIKLIASNVTVSHFMIEDSWSDPVYEYSSIQSGTYWPDKLYNITLSDCIISDCIISNATIGILGSHMGYKNHTTIRNNHIRHCYRVGMYVSSVNILEPVYTIKGDFNVSGNVVTDCPIGIYVVSNRQNVSGNRIKRCEYGIFLYGEYNIIFGNDVDSCSVGVCDAYVPSDGNSITKNNFRNYSRGGVWWVRIPSFISMILNILRKQGWKENYWDTWIGAGPKLIPGGFALRTETLVPWFHFDWKPAKEPYDVPRNDLKNL
jgi:parallel beta-helix repeat protein